MITTPLSADPVELYKWAQDLVQQLQLQSQASADASAGSTSAVSSNVPAGSMVLWGGIDAPEGWIEATGQLLARSDFPSLFAAIGTRFNTGGEDETLFRLPDGRNRMLSGARETLYGGSATVTLTAGNLPEVELTVDDPGHTHTFTGEPHSHDVTDPQHSHGVTGNFLTAGGTVAVGAGAVEIPVGTAGTASTVNASTGVTVNNTTQGGSNANAQAGISVTLPGEAEPVEILPEYLALNLIIKT